MSDIPRSDSMKRACFAFLLLFASAMVFAQDATSSAPATAEDIQQFFQLINTRKQMDSISSIMAGQIPQMSEETMQRELPDATPEQVKLFRDYMKQSVQDSL